MEGWEIGSERERHVGHGWRAVEHSTVEVVAVLVENVRVEGQCERKGRSEVVARFGCHRVFALLVDVDPVDDGDRLRERDR